MGSDRDCEILAADFYRGKNHREVSPVILKSISKAKSFGTHHFSGEIIIFSSPKLLVQHDNASESS